MPPRQRNRNRYPDRTEIQRQGPDAKRSITGSEVTRLHGVAGAIRAKLTRKREQLRLLTREVDELTRLAQKADRAYEEVEAIFDRETIVVDPG